MQTCRIAAILMSERPKPERAPERDAIEHVRQKVQR